LCPCMCFFPLSLRSSMLLESTQQVWLPFSVLWFCGRCRAVIRSSPLLIYWQPFPLCFPTPEGKVITASFCFCVPKLIGVRTLFSFLTTCEPAWQHTHLRLFPSHSIPSSHTQILPWVWRLQTVLSWPGFLLNLFHSQTLGFST
jgi:hypothetical protein